MFAENVFSGGMEGAEQEIGFHLLVQNIAFEKVVGVHWCSPDGVWRVAPAHYLNTRRDGEVWRATASYQRPSANVPAGAIEFAAHLSAGGRDAWDNNAGQNYRLPPAGGVRLGPGIAVLALRPDAVLAGAVQAYPVTVAVDEAIHPRTVQVRWTTDGWHSWTTTSCIRRSSARATRRESGGAAIWSAVIPVGDVLRLEFAVCCETRGGDVVWDNNAGANYTAARARLKVLTLNLHCYQEENWDAKFWQIARAINEHDVDIVCLQEVAEPWNQGQGDGVYNAARIIRDRLKQRYHLASDWSHLGFGQYREGSAILSRYDLAIKDSGYVSASHDPYDIHARKVVMVQTNVPFLGPVNVFSTHLSWWNDGFRTQFENLRHWADGRHTCGIAATLICGDFNSVPSSEGYRLATLGGEYEDQYLKVHRKNGLNGDVAAGRDQRIDYIFLKKGSALEAVVSKVLFTPDDYGIVSDHPGYYAEFEIAG
jgi:maltose 6'-phosphate phosphatase